MKSIKVKNLTQALLFLGYGEDQISIAAGESKKFSETEYLKYAKSCDSFHSSKMLEIKYEEAKAGKKSDANPENNAGAGKPDESAEAKTAIKAQLKKLQEEFKTAGKARKEQIALEVENLKDEAKKLK